MHEMEIYTKWKCEKNIKTVKGKTCTKAKFRRRTSHKPNRMQMRQILCSPSLAYDSAHVKFA